MKKLTRTIREGGSAGKGIDSQTKRGGQEMNDRLFYLKPHTWLFVAGFLFFCFAARASTGNDQITSYTTAQTFLIIGAIYEWSQ
jgi:hypothetical protein